MKKLLIPFLIFTVLFSNAQAILSPGKVVGCGSFEYMKHIDSQEPGFIELSNDLIKSITNVVSNQKQSRNQDIYVIPIVFHIVYNNDAENLHDSVILNQIKTLNKNFRRKIADTTNTRNEFLDLVGDSRIEFVLAGTDPQGNAVTGITRTNTNIAYFGDTLPYGSGQNTEINQWVNDHFYDNLFRITQTSEGGIDPWDKDRYLNVWIGDLRIFEPEFDNFEELVFFGLSTPPDNLDNWPPSIYELLDGYNHGILMHYINIGSNNPNNFPSAYNVYNGLVNTGKMLVHEVGHYLGLRHIWGDGNCSEEDFIDDTPNADNHSQYTCDPNSNTCVDNINGTDLPNMIENYMDYSSADCKNSFTNGQISLMRAVIEINRPNLLTKVDKLNSSAELILFPNPTNGIINIKSNQKFDIEVFNSTGICIKKTKYTTSIDLSGQAVGIYLVKLTYKTKQIIRTIIKN